ncbi:MAG: Rieske 2Fe-2S domain-containing protein [Patescibacteria group bacterium]
MPSWIELAAIDAIPDGSTTLVRYGFQGVWIVRRGDSFRAFLNLCTHAGAPLRLCGTKLCCQRHEATFDAETGRALSAPAPLDSFLPPVPLEVRDGKIFAPRKESGDGLG